MKKLNFMSIGYSTEDQNVFNDKHVDLMKELNPMFLDCLTNSVLNMLSYIKIEDLDFSVKEKVDFLGRVKDDENYADDEEMQKAVDEFEKFVEGKEGLFWSWSVEYDDNVCFIENVTKEELVDIFQKWSDEYAKQNED